MYSSIKIIGSSRGADTCLPMGTQVEIITVLSLLCYAFVSLKGQNDLRYKS